MKKERYLGKEDDFQKAVARYLDSLGVLWTHVNNEGMHKIQYRAKMKAKGVKPGVPDVLIFEPKGTFTGLAIELKVGYNQPSDYQKQWIVNLAEKGWFVVLTYSLDHCLGVIDNYLKGQNMPFSCDTSDLKTKNNAIPNNTRKTRL